MQAEAHIVTPELRLLSSGGDGPFSLQLDDGTTLTCERIVRRVPGRRLVCSGKWNGSPVFAKIFIGKEHAKYCDRDHHGVNALLKGGILTPGILAAAHLPQQAADVLIFQAIEHARNAEDMLKSLGNGDDERKCLAETLVHTVAAHHSSGLIQHDLYLKNFLIQGTDVYTLDGDSIRTARLSLRSAMKNLELLFSKFPPEEDARIPMLWEIYASARGLVAREREAAYLIDQASALRRHMVRKYADKKVLRSCTDVETVTLKGARIAATRAYWRLEFMPLMLHPDDFLHPDRCTRLKSGRSATIGLVDIADTRIVVKRYNSRGMARDLTHACLGKSRAEASWRNAHRLRILNIPTPQPIAYVRNRTGLASSRSYYLCEYVDAPNALCFFDDPTISQADKETAAQNIAGLLHRLYLVGIEHGDMKGTNIKIRANETILIDLDGMRQFAPGMLFLRRHKKDLARLMQNWQSNLDISRLIGDALLLVYAHEAVLKEYIQSLMPKNRGHQTV